MSASQAKRIAELEQQLRHAEDDLSQAYGIRHSIPGAPHRAISIVPQWHGREWWCIQFDAIGEAPRFFIGDQWVSANHAPEDIYSWRLEDARPVARRLVEQESEPATERPTYIGPDEFLAEFASEGVAA